MAVTRNVSEPAFGDPVGPWHRWFAWRPVRTVDRGLRWLRPLWRRRYQTKGHLPGPTYHWFHHAVADPNGVEYEGGDTNAGDREEAWEDVRETVEKAVNSCYGTDPRHGLLANAVADQIVYGKPIPWGLAKHFGQSDHMG